jgi:anhydro-N-acetylmuramic acid kinase
MTMMLNPYFWKPSGEILVPANLTKFSIVVYNAIGLMSGSSLDGLDIVFAEFNEQGGKWSYEIRESECYSYDAEWKNKLESATSLSAEEYLLLHSEFGHYLGREVHRFIQSHGLEYKVALVASHGHTTFHRPDRRMTAQLGDGAAIAAELGLPVITDLRALDVALGGQGAPIVPIGEKLLLGGHEYYLNIGGIANISFSSDTYIAYDVCPANRVLNLLAGEAGKEFDDRGAMAASGTINAEVLSRLNAQEYYGYPYPKSLANDFGTGILYPIVRAAGNVPDALRTYIEHICDQLKNAILRLPPSRKGARMLVTGGGALNDFLVNRLKTRLEVLGVELVVPSPELISNKEALIMAFIGVLRWRQESNVLSSVTGATRDSAGGAVWHG